MSTIRCIYSEEPNFPATDNHPDAVRYVINGAWIDAIDGEPTQEEVDAVLNTPIVKQLTIDALADALTKKGVLSPADVATAVEATAVDPGVASIKS